MPDHSLRQQLYINYAYDISNDKRFVYLLKAENGQITPDRRHPSDNNVVGVDYGFCGINNFFHKGIIADPRFVNDWRWQLRECYRLYTEGVTFYGLRRIDRVIKFFNFKS